MMEVLKEGALVLKTAGTVIDNGLSPQTTYHVPTTTLWERRRFQFVPKKNLHQINDEGFKGRRFGIINGRDGD